MSEKQSSWNETNKSDFFRAPMPPPSTLSATNLIKSIRASKFSDAPPSTAGGTNGSQATARPSKFSDAPPPQAQPKLDPVAAAAAAAAKINANLRAKGKLSDQTQTKPIVSVNQGTSLPLSLIQIAETRKVFSSYIAKIDINDLPLSCRTYFTQVNVQENLNKLTGAAISTKGQYLTPTEKKSLDGIEKQLHLFIQSPDKEKTDTALSKLKEMISKQKMPGPPLGNLPLSNNLPAMGLKVITGQPTLPTGNFVQEKVFVGMDYIPPEFDLKSKLLGVNYANFNFVANATGAKVILRGRGSGFLEPTSGREAFESMYVFISHPSQGGIDAARKLVYNLISTVHNEYTTCMTQKMGSGFGPPNSSNFSSTGNFQAYPSNHVVPPNPYNNMPMPSNNNPYVTNQYDMPPLGSGHPFSATAPPAMPTNAYGLPTNTSYNTATVNSYNMPPPPISHSPAPQDNAKSEMKPPSHPVSAKPPEPKPPKRRRFKEEQPDDSNILGYKQVSAKTNKDSADKGKKPKRTFDETLNNTKPPEAIEEKAATNLPFWMSHN